MKKHTSVVLTIFITALFSCSEVAGEFTYMNRLKEAISEKYETEKIEINIKNDDELIVSLIDPKFDEYSETKKERISREIGQLAQELREDKETIKSGLVNFRDEENYGVVKASSTETFKMYE